MAKIQTNIHTHIAEQLQSAKVKTDVTVQLQKLLWPVFALYAIVVLYGVTNHEPWRDEAQAWLLTRDLTFSGLFHILRSEGHPPLWYLLISPFSKTGMPYVMQQWLAAAIMIGAVYIMMFRTQIPSTIKLLAPFSYFFLFEYALVARSYCLVFFFMAAIISLYPQRFDKPIWFAICVVGLYNTHILIFAFCLALTGLCILDVVQYKKVNVQTVAGVIIMCIGGGYLVPYLVLARGTSIFEDQIDHLQQLKNAIGNGMLVDGNFLLALLLLMALTLMLVKRTKPLLLLLAGSFGVLYILGFKYNIGELRHQGILFAIVFGVYAIAPFYKDDVLNFPRVDNAAFLKYGTWVLTLVIVLQLPPALGKYMSDKDGVFSDAKNAAAYIHNNKMENNIIVGEQAWAASALTPFLPHVNIYYAECQRYGTYYIYDSCFIKNNWQLPVDYAIVTAFRNFRDKADKIVFVLNAPVKTKMEKYLDLVYHTEDQPIRPDEAFYIYKFKKGIDL